MVGKALYMGRVWEVMLMAGKGHRKRATTNESNDA
jgi:hypothetical protein